MAVLLLCCSHRREVTPGKFPAAEARGEQHNALARHGGRQEASGRAARAAGHAKPLSSTAESPQPRAHSPGAFGNRAAERVTARRVASAASRGSSGVLRDRTQN